MSYNGTVTCRHCYNRGHNKRTCPSLTDLFKRNALRAVEAGGDGVMDNYAIKQYEKRIGHMMDGSPLPKAVRAQSARRCTYCGSQGHNRRTCTTLQTNMTRYRELAIEFRIRLEAAMRAAGCGVGALLKTERWGETYCWMISAINWSGVDHTRFAHMELLQGRNIKTVEAWNQLAWMAFPTLTDEQGTLNENRSGLSVVIGPVPLAGVPADFTDPASLDGLVRDTFDKDARSACYWDNYHNVQD